ncbi:MAG TPA: hypothetical protein VIM29_08525 [Bacillota bacterium]
MNKKTWLLMALLLVLVMVPVAAADPGSDVLVFLQADQGQKTLFLYETGRPQPVKITGGKAVKVFFENRHLLYFVNQQLFEYDLARHQSKLLNKFNEKEIELGTVAASNGLQQMLIAAKGDYEINYYILDLNDASIRRVERPWGSGVPRSRSGLLTKDRQYVAIPKVSMLKNRVELRVERKKGSRYQNFWTLPVEFTVLPELLSWSPNSKLLLFHAKKNTGYEGFYSLYCFDVETKKMQLLAETVLFYDWIGFAGLEEFLPDWSADSQFLVFQSQPTGSPSYSEIIRYEIKSGKSKILTKSAGQNQSPRIAPSGNRIAFLSNREGSKQLYLMDSQGGTVKRLSTQGITEWAEWFKK